MEGFAAIPKKLNEKGLKDEFQKEQGRILYLNPYIKFRCKELKEEVKCELVQLRNKM